MTQSELKQKLYDLVSLYFSGANIVWGKIRLVNPNAPQVTLNMGTVTRLYHSIGTDVGGVPIKSYPSRTTLQIDLNTRGAGLNHEGSKTSAMENTAVNDLIAFLNFLGSDYVDNWTLTNDISIMTNQVHDLTQLVNDVSWDYRAMAELEIGFMENAAGFTGVNYEGGMPYWGNGNPKYDTDGNPLDPDGSQIPPELDGDGNPIPPPPPSEFEPNPSGGGSKELVEQFTGWFNEVDGPEYVTKKE